MKYIKQGTKYYEVNEEFNKTDRLNSVKIEKDRLKTWKEEQKKRIDSLYQRRLDALNSEEKELNNL